MFFTVSTCAVVILLMQTAGMRVFPHVLRIPPHYMYPALMIICVISAFVESSNLYKCGMMLVFCAVGVIMSLGGLPTSPLILSFILGPILEKNMLKGFQIGGTWTSFFTRPISGILMAVGILCIFSPVVRMLWEKYKGRKAQN